MNYMLSVLLIALGVALIIPSAPAVAEEAETDGADAMAQLTAALELTDEQVPKVGAALQTFATSMEAATAQTEGEEPDNQKIIGDIKKAKSQFSDDMKGALTEEQYTKFESTVDAVIQETFNDVAEIKIMDLEPVLELTEEQSAALVPVIGSSLRQVVAVIMEYGDKKLNKRTKIKMGKKLKGIQGDTNKAMSEILTEEQMDKYNAYKEAQKEEKESKEG